MNPLGDLHQIAAPFKKADGLFTSVVARSLVIVVNLA